MEIIKKEQLAANDWEVTFKTPPDAWDKYVEKVFNKEKSKIRIPGFRPGKAPRNIVERRYGQEVFFEDAADLAFRDAMREIIDDKELLGKNVVGSEKSELVEVSKENGAEFKVVLNTYPDVSVSGYKGLEVEEFNENVSEREIEEELENYRKKLGSLVTAERDDIQNGDFIEFDFEGFIDGVPFDGGKGIGQELEIGSGRFIPGFEEQLTGKKLGGEFDINVTFPESYHAVELKGKTAVFKCTVHAIRVKLLPELDDEFAKDASNEFETLEEFKDSIKKRLHENKLKNKDRYYQGKVEEILPEKIEAEIPKTMFEHKIDEFVENWELQNRMRGLTLRNFLAATKMDFPSFRNMFREQATKEVKLILALEKIAELEGIEASSEEIENQYAEYVKNGPDGISAEKVREVISEESVIQDIKNDKARKFVIDSVKIIPNKSE